MNQKSYFMLLEAAWKAVHLTLILYMCQNYGQERHLKILTRNSGSVRTGNPGFFAAKHLTLMEFKTLTFEIGGLSETNHVENHKSIPIYN